MLTILYLSIYTLVSITLGFIVGTIIAYGMGG